nr:MAG TPA: hypothetical protein [Caudoviricetes sp.]
MESNVMAHGQEIGTKLILQRQMSMNYTDIQAMFNLQHFKF